MHRFLRMVSGVSLVALTWSTAVLAGSNIDLKRVSLPTEPAVCAAAPDDDVFANHKIGPFCDATADHGTSASCKAEAQAKGLVVCPAGTSATNLNCSVGNDCPGNGKWCTCTYDCVGAVPVDPVAVEP